MSEENLKFVIECEMKARWVPYFLSALKYMQKLGSWGSSRYVIFYADGDGDFRPRFKWNSNLPDIEMSCEEIGQIIKISEGDRIFDAG